MTKYSDAALSVLLWFFGGTLYFLLEVAYKTATGKPEAISWTMLVLAIILCIPVERCGEQIPWDCPLWAQAISCAALVTVVELFAGLIMNVRLGLGVWDYSHLPGNICGQVCPQFFVVWFALCFAFIPIFDWIRWAVQGGEKPHYKIMGVEET